MTEPFKQRTILDAMRERKKLLEEQVKASPPQGEEPPPPPKPKKEPLLPQNKINQGKPAPPPYSHFERVKVKCGHEIQFGCWPDKKDKWREQRRAKKVAKICPACREEILKKEMAEAEERRKEKRKAQREANGGISPKYKIRGRLPQGSYFARLIWDGENWSGTLVVPQGLEEPLCFRREYPNLFPLLSKLDMDYRRTTPAWEEYKVWLQETNQRHEEGRLRNLEKMAKKAAGAEKPLPEPAEAKTGISPPPAVPPLPAPSTDVQTGTAKKRKGKKTGP